MTRANAFTYLLSSFETHVFAISTACASVADNATFTVDNRRGDAFLRVNIGGEELALELSALRALGRDARSVFQYAFTKMLNNAIEHSGSRAVEIRFEAIRGGLAFEIVDEGRGAFANVRRTLRPRIRPGGARGAEQGKAHHPARGTHRRAPGSSPGPRRDAC